MLDYRLLLSIIMRLYVNIPNVKTCINVKAITILTTILINYGENTNILFSNFNCVPVVQVRRDTIKKIR